MSYNNQRQKIYEEPRREDSRRSFLFRSSSLISSGIATAFSSNTANAAQLPPIDTKAPDFSLFSSKGIQTTLSDLTKDGKWTVLYFYPGKFKLFALKIVSKMIGNALFNFDFHRNNLFIHVFLMKLLLS